MSTKQPASAHNAPTLDDEVTLALRAITEKRAATLGYLLDESRQRHQPDDYARDAIRHYGRDTPLAPWVAPRRAAIWKTTSPCFRITPALSSRSLSLAIR